MNNNITLEKFLDILDPNIKKQYELYQRDVTTLKTGTMVRTIRNGSWGFAGQIMKIARVPKLKNEDTITLRGHSGDYYSSINEYWLDFVIVNEPVNDEINVNWI